MANTANQYYRLRSGLTILPSHQRNIDDILSKLVQKVPARFVLLTDVTGQIISVRGEQGKINVVALGSLVAGDLAASQEIARLMGEYEDFQMILREGQLTHTFIVEAGRYFALMVQVSQEVPLGWARMLIQDASKQLPAVMEKELDKQDTAFSQKMEAETNQVLESENLSDLFDDALDDLWSE